MSLYAALIRTPLFTLNPENAHHLTLNLMKVGLWGPLGGAFAACTRVSDPRLAQTLWGLEFPNPVGLAAGMDKEGECIEPFAKLGFSHVEIGTVTGQGQPGNPQPRLFRLPSDHGVINRMGFNNTGADSVAARLKKAYPAGRRPGCVLGINLGKTKLVELDHALDDYRRSVQALGALADYVVVNVSSPNTPGLRDLQGEAFLRPLLAGVRAELNAIAPNKPLLLKIAPDLAEAGIDAAVDVALETGCDGMICTNTTITRDGLTTSAERIAAIGAGGLSGAPVRAKSTAVLARVARRVQGRVPVIGVGGIDSVDAAWEKITHGATLVQVYSGLIYEGPTLIRRINCGLLKKLDEHKLAKLSDAIGRDL
jgi:dihydroorotate dehydrogenase